MVGLRSPDYTRPRRCASPGSPWRRRTPRLVAEPPRRRASHRRTACSTAAGRTGCAAVYCGLQAPEQRDPRELRRFAEDSAELGAAFAAAQTPYLEGRYPGQAWPVDSVVAIASLRLHDFPVPAAKYAPDPQTGWLRERAGKARSSNGTVAPTACTRKPAHPRGSRSWYAHKALLNRFLSESTRTRWPSNICAFVKRYVVSPLESRTRGARVPGWRGPPGGRGLRPPCPLGISLSASVVDHRRGPGARRPACWPGRWPTTPSSPVYRWRRRGRSGTGSGWCRSATRSPGVVEDGPAVGGGHPLAARACRVAVVAHPVAAPDGSDRYGSIDARHRGEVAADAVITWTAVT